MLRKLSTAPDVDELRSIRGPGKRVPAPVVLRQLVEPRAVRLDRVQVPGRERATGDVLTAYERDDSSPGGFRPLAYEAAIDRVAGEIQRIQSAHGPDAFAVLSGASLTTEKAYLMGKFARLALRTRHIDYNGRLCMVSAGAANRMAFGIDRGGQPWSDIPLAKCLILAGINVGECFPILTDYIWRA